MPRPTDNLSDSDHARLSERIVERAKSMGFALAGIIPCAPSAHEKEFRDWLEAGAHGEMEYLARNFDLRMDPARMLDGAASMLLVADQYADRSPSTLDHATGEQKIAAPRGRIARYARGEDYHRVMKQRLHELADALREEYPDASFRSFVDTAPVLEREHAARAGLGWIGKHTLLIHPRRGSWLLLGGLLTTLELVPPRIQREEPDHCGTCIRCIQACPTDAITPYRVDASRCISYLTIEHRSMIDPVYHEAMADWIFGCDICQEVCPHNSVRKGNVPTGVANPAYEQRLDSFDLLEVLGWTEEDRRRAVARSALKRAKLEMFQRNAIIAAGNVLRHRDIPELRKKITHLAGDREASGQVRDTARDVLSELDRARSSASPASAQAESSDDSQCQ